MDEIRGLDRYHVLHAARADLLRRANRAPEAARAYHLAIEFARNERERTFLERRFVGGPQAAAPNPDSRPSIGPRLDPASAGPSHSCGR
jgi:hypothetical protein